MIECLALTIRVRRMAFIPSTLSIAYSCKLSSQPVDGVRRLTAAFRGVQWPTYTTRGTVRSTQGWPPGSRLTASIAAWTARSKLVSSAYRCRSRIVRAIASGGRGTSAAGVAGAPKPSAACAVGRCPRFTGVGISRYMPTYTRPGARS